MTGSDPKHFDQAYLLNAGRFVPHVWCRCGHVEAAHWNGERCHARRRTLILRRLKRCRRRQLCEPS